MGLSYIQLINSQTGFLQWVLQWIAPLVNFDSTISMAAIKPTAISNDLFGQSCSCGKGILFSWTQKVLHFIALLLSYYTAWLGSNCNTLPNDSLIRQGHNWVSVRILKVCNAHKAFMVELSYRSHRKIVPSYYNSAIIASWVGDYTLRNLTSPFGHFSLAGQLV